MPLCHEPPSAIVDCLLDFVRDASRQHHHLAALLRQISKPWQAALSHLEPHQEWEGHKGWIHEIFRDNFLATHPDPGRCSFYVCGPPPMLEAVLNLLRGAGIREEKIAFDDFGI